jgi:prepilin-type N-terminal cleavage/methylation domain-containing protein
MVKNNEGFTLVEVMVSLILVALLLGVMSTVIQNAMTLNAKTTLLADAGALAFKKAQDYINLEYDDVPIGDDVSNYEIEDFSLEAEALNLKNANAKVYSEPASQISGSAPVVTNYTQSIAANTAFVDGGKINVVDEHDATGDWFYDRNIRDNNLFNYTISYDTTNSPSPSIELESPQAIGTLQINWFRCGYGSGNFRVEAKNSSPGSNSGWTIIKSGLSNNTISCINLDNPQSIDVSSNTTPYKYWRVFFVTVEDDDYSVVSELQAYSSASPSDTVEQHGAGASSIPGNLYFSDTSLELSEDGVRGQQSTGLIFKGINATQGSTIDNAYINFTPAETSLPANVTLRIRAANVDNASQWSGNYAVDRAVDTDSSDGSVGTNAFIDWTPENWVSGISGANTQVNVTSIIQELVNRVGWSADNDIAITIQYISGSGRKITTRLPAPQLVIDWSRTTTSTSGNYVDTDNDGDVDNPTLLKITTVLEYEAFQKPYKVEYVTYMRKFGVGD